MSPERLPPDFHLAASCGPGAGAPSASVLSVLEGSSRPPTDANLNSLSQEYLYEDIVAATGGLSAASRLGMGTYGSVYQGTLRDGTEVAVKALSRPNESGFREEVEVLSRFRHPNLVILMGFARHAEERYLVYELLPGGDVCARLQKDASFTWRPRLSVILDAALGLSHLHGSRPQVFHRDIKTQNILMDRNGTGKMADFGLALLAKPECRSMTVENTSGTIGYADPLYIRTGRVTEASEVYSFGMVLLEILTGKPPALQHADGRIEYSFGHLGGDLSRVRAMLDPRGQWPPGVGSLVGSLALRCVHQQEALRPTFAEVVGDLRRWLREQRPEGAQPPPVASYAAAGASLLSPSVAQTGAGPSMGAQLDGSSFTPAGAGERLFGVCGAVPSLPSRGSLGYPSAAPGRQPPARRGSFPLVFDCGPGADSGANAGPRRVPLQLAGWGTSQSSSSGPPHHAVRMQSPALESAFEHGGPIREAALDSGLGAGEGASGGSLLVDGSPRACVDCGPPLPPALSALPPAARPPPAAAPGGAGGVGGARSSWLLGSRSAVASPGAAPGASGADVWIDPRPPPNAVVDSAGGGLLESSLVLHGVGSLDAAGKAEEATMPAARSATKVTEEQRAIMLQLKAEMGFSDMQVSEALKRCSTAEGAIDWILSPEREWNLQ